MSSYVNHHHHHRHHQHRVRFCTRTWLSTVSQLHCYDTGFQMNIFANMDLLAIWAVIFGPLDSKCINYSRTNESFPLKSSAHDSSRNRKHKSLTKRLEHNCKKKKRKRKRTLVIATLLDWREWPKLREFDKLITMPVMRKDHAVREGMCCGEGWGGRAED